MSDTLRMWVEILFNISYLVVVWWLIGLMLRNREKLAPADRRLAKLVLLAFILLASGDMGHVGFRVLAYARGELSAAGDAASASTLVGIGSLMTAVTVTFFYALVVWMWAERFQRQIGLAGYLLLAAGVVRLIIMAFPQNQWNSTVPPQPMSLIRNIPLMVQGLGVAYLILRDAAAQHDRLFRRIGICILLSYSFYLPVILFVQVVPIVGMLMIPKTIAYVAIAYLAYVGLYQSPSTAFAAAATAGK